MEQLKEMNERHHYLEERQTLLQRARLIMENQIYLDRENRIVLAEILGEDNLPVSAEQLSTLLFTTLGKYYPSLNVKEAK
jgi:hypothetical protein